MYPLMEATRKENERERTFLERRKTIVIVV
jgi:hypothetical protein